ncbi:MAG: hypothetical protein GX663_04295 [Clostridiales bacterium]|nr:hypothetical protein [Clostridiales bacterium]
MGRIRKPSPVLPVVVLLLAATLAVVALLSAALLPEETLQPTKYLQPATTTRSKVTVTPHRQILISLGQEPSTVFISWKGNRGGPAYLRYADEQKDLPQAKIIKADKKHILGSKYYRYSVKVENTGRCFYEIGDGVAFDRPRFIEKRNSGNKTRFLFFGDVQLEGEVPYWEQMIKEACPEDCDFAMFGGDMVNVPTDLSQWERFLNNCGVFDSLPVMTAAGNHEGVHSNVTYRKIFASPGNGPKGLKEEFYFFDYGSCRVLVLDSSFFTDARKGKLGEARWNSQRKSINRWLTKTLNESPKLWNIAVIHHPPYGMHSDKEVSEDLRKWWVPLLEKYRVDLVLSGHQHLYMRTRPINGIVYLMGNSGVRSSRFYDGRNKPFYVDCVYAEGAGYQMIEVDLRGLKISACNKKGRIVDEALIKKSSFLHILKFLGGN